MYKTLNKKLRVPKIMCNHSFGVGMVTQRFENVYIELKRVPKRRTKKTNLKQKMVEPFKSALII